MADAPIKDAGIYIRVSTLDQGERTSPGSQREKLLSKARSEGYRVLPQHIFEDHHTGKETARPDFERMRKAVKSGALQATFALGVDRLARKVVDAAVVAAEFKRYGCILDFYEMKNDDSPEGRFTFNMLASVAEYMGEKIVEKGRDGQMRLLLEDRIPGGAIIFGHDRHPTEKGRRIKNEAEAAIVLQMCQMLDAGTSSYAVAAWLNARKIRGKGSNGKPGVEWSDKTVRRLVTNPSIIGQCHTRGKIIPVPRLVPDDLFYRVRKRLMENAKRLAGRKPGKSLLSGFLFDEYGDKHRWTVKDKKGGKSRGYICNHKTNKPPTRRLCDMPQIAAFRIEEPAFDLLWGSITDPAKLLRGARAFVRSQPKPESSVSVAERERELATAKRAYNNLRHMCEKGHYEFADKEEELNAQRRRITVLEAELRSVARVQPMPEEHEVQALARRAAAMPKPVTFAKQRKILEDLVDFKVTYYRSGEFVLTGSIPLGPSGAMGENWDRSLGTDSNSPPKSIPLYLKGRVLPAAPKQTRETALKIWAARRKNGTTTPAIAPERRREMRLKAWETRRKKKGRAA